jgi:hypothetical protein
VPTPFSLCSQARTQEGKLALLLLSPRAPMWRHGRARGAEAEGEQGGVVTTTGAVMIILLWLIGQFGWSGRVST